MATRTKIPVPITFSTVRGLILLKADFIQIENDSIRVRFPIGCPAEPADDVFEIRASEADLIAMPRWL